MTDDELRAKAEAWIESVERVNGLLVDAGVGPLEDGAAFARRLLELLPPPDDGDAVTIERFVVMGGVQAPDKTASIRVSDVCVLVFYPAGVFGPADRLCLWVPHDGAIVDVTNTVGQVRRLLSALGIHLTEPSPCPTPSQSSGTAAATGCGATGPGTASC
jgi:hypothetical protein